MNHLKAYILFPGAAKNPLYDGWLDPLPLPAEIVREYDRQWLPPEDAGIVITHNHYRWEELSILRRIVGETRVPVLILVDGILEFRNSFEHPDLVDGSMFQPLLGHKLACLGESQIRWIESWGNAGKCELVGLPRLDARVTAPRRELPVEGPFRLLVASARTPWFDESQREETHRALGAVKQFLDGTETIRQRPLQVIWRMAEALHHNLQAPGFVRRPAPVQQVLEEVHAVITTPSTLQLEAATCGLPVAVVDFHNSPPMTPMAWTIHHESQIPAVIDELAFPPPAKRLAQDSLVADALQQFEPAAERMTRLVDTMVRAGIQARESGGQIELPERILAHPHDGFRTAQPAAARQRLYPENPVFGDTSLEHLRTELAAAIQEMGRYPEKYFQQRTANQKLRSYINWLRLLVRNRAATVDELSEALQKLRSGQDDRPVKER